MRLRRQLMHHRSPLTSQPARSERAPKVRARLAERTTALFLLVLLVCPGLSVFGTDGTPVSQSHGKSRDKSQYEQNNSALQAWPSPNGVLEGMRSGGNVRALDKSEKVAQPSSGDFNLPDYYRGISSGKRPARELAAAATPAKAASLLFVSESKGFRHGSVTRKGDNLSVAEEVMTQLGVSTGLFRAECTQDSAKDFTRQKLDTVDIVMFYTTGDLPISEELRDYFFKTWLKQPGHGFIGVHSAADTYHNYEPYWDMIGGTFDGHPWGADSSVTVTVHDTTHPISKVWGEEFTIRDEIYRFKNWQPEKVHVLMSLNMAKTDLKEPYHVPVAWVKNYGEGKVAHMSLGHREDVWTNPTYQESLAGAVRWILGQEPGDASPNPELSATEQKKAEAVAQEAKGK